MKQITTTSGASYIAITEPFQSSIFAGAPFPEGHPSEGEPMFELQLVIFQDIRGDQVSLVVSHIESIVDFATPLSQPPAEQETNVSKLTMPGNVQVPRTD